MKKLSFCVLVMMCYAVLTAQEQPLEERPVRTITVDDAVVLAADNNISLKQQKLSLDLLKKQKDTSWNSVSPTLKLSGSYGDSLGGTHESWASGNPTLQSDGLSAMVSLTINLAPSLYTSIQDAKISYEAGEISYEDMVRSVELSVRKSFYSLLYSKENIALQESALESARQTYESSLAKYNQGRISELDLLTSQFNYESKRPAIDSLKNSYEISLDSFKQVLGIDLREDLILEGSLEEVAEISISEEALFMDLDSIPSVKTAQMNVQSAENSLLATRFSAWGPSILASANVTENVKTESLNLRYSLTVSIPLDGYLPWSTGAMSIASQKTNLEKLKLAVEDTKTSAAIQIRSSYNTILQAQSQLSTYEKNVELMQRTYDMSQRAYNAGSSDLLALQTAADNLASAKNTLQNQRYTIISAVLDLENTLGVPFGTLAEEN